MVHNDLKGREAEIDALVKQVQKASEEAFSKLYDIFIDPIYRYIYYRVNSDDAEDLVENLFLKVWENICQYKPKNRSFSAWIFRIAHNLIVDYYRSQKDSFVAELDSRLPDLDREHNPIRKTQNVLDKELLKSAIAKLKKQYQDVIIYKFINELSNQEISQILDKSEGSLRILQFRALKALKRELSGMGVDYL